MRRMFLCVSSLLFLLATVSAEQASSGEKNQSGSGDAATRGQVMEFLQVMDMRKGLDAMVPIFQQQMTEQAAHLREQFPDLKADDFASIASEQEQLVSQLFKRMPIDKIEGDLVPIYQKYYSRAEMDAILSFYESPVGRKVRDTMPAIMGESMPIMNARMQPVIDELMKEMRERIEQRIRKSPSTAK